MSVLDRFSHEDLDAIRLGRFNLGINTSFIIYRIGDTVIDTASPNQRRLAKQFIQEKPLRQLLITHHHEDHAGNAEAIRKLTGVTPLAPELTKEKLRNGFNIPLMQKLIWGSPGRAHTEELPDELVLDNGDAITPVFAPGHAKDMTCYLIKDRGWLFSADLYIANRLKLLRADEDVPTLLNSVQKVLTYDFDTLFCPHRGIVPEGQQRLKEKYDFIVNLAGDAQHLHQKGFSDIDISEQLLGKEGWFSKLSGYNFSKRNLIQSCLDVSL